jgi:hypothetical protein
MASLSSTSFFNQFDPPREKRILRDETILSLIPFGFSATENVLEHFLGTPDLITNVL